MMQRVMRANAPGGGGEALQFEGEAVNRRWQYRSHAGQVTHSHMALLDLCYHPLSSSLDPRTAHGFKPSASCLDLIGKMLTIDPEARPSAAEITSHPWFKQVWEAMSALNGGGDAVSF